MDTAIATRASFDPPPPRGHGRAFMLALLIHALLVLALAWGLRWKKEAQDMAVETELWSATAQTAAPKAVAVQPPPPPPQQVAPPRPVPVPKPVPQVHDDTARQAELALEQQKKRQEQARKAEQAREQAQRQAAEAAAAQAKAVKDAQAAAQAEAAKEKAAEQKTAAAKAAEQKAADQAKADAARRQATLRNLRALASADQVGMTNAAVSGQGKTASGHANRDAGPSAGYGAKVRARVKPNIVYPDLSSISGNPKVEVEVWASPDGTIIDRRIVKSSGVSSWDAAAVRAIDKTQTLPRDVDGSVPSPFTIGFTPND
ncbi:MAG: cell envelope integrity protein TolA [Burkholderiaceae bacterium]|nr:cell envelope integrity protein TolA [Burkholderiaceae bacterium]